MSKRLITYGLALLAVFGIFVQGVQATQVYPEFSYSMEIFTNNGHYSDSSEIDIYFTAFSNEQDSTVEFVFHNESLIDCSIAEIYFEDNESILDLIGITNGPGTVFNAPAVPKNLPAANQLDPVFLATLGLTFDSDAPVAENGINPGEWIKAGFDLNYGTFEDLFAQFEASDIRVGVHLIALSDGSSESAINVPEPAMVSLLGVGMLCLIGKRKVS